MSREKQTYNPCDDCQYSYSKNNQESGMCKICEFAYFRDCKQSEVAREIFWEIDKLLTRIITDDENGTQFIGVDMQKYYALKKKYTEERT